MSTIDVTDVAVSFGDVHALKKVSLQVTKGEVCGLLGPNGAGKTTLVNVISTLLRPDSGTAKVAGFDVTTHPHSVRSAIGLAGQYAAVDEVLTGRENLEIVASLYQLPKKEAKRRAAETLERLSLSDAADRGVRTYSGGMRRRLDLGACLVGKPEVLLLDEPTTGLDPRTRLELWDFLRELVADGTTVLLTTQYLEEADELADNIVVIDHGSVIAEGSADSLKDLIGGATLSVTPTQASDIPKTSEILASLNEATPRIDKQKKCVLLKTAASASLVIKAAMLLEKQNIDLSDIRLDKPTLDEVFLGITGKPADSTSKGVST